MHRRDLLKGAVGGLAIAAIPTPARAKTPARPWTIPAIRAWTPRPGSFRLAPESRIVVDRAAWATLSPAAAMLAADLRRLTGRTPSIIGGEPDDARRGDVSLDLRARDPDLGGEGYRLTAGRTAEISARAGGAAGAFYGTRTLVQLLRQGRAIPAGIARDWPRYPERGLLVDIGRQHFDAAWLARCVNELGDLKLNLLHLHFTENLGWRIASDGHPEVVSEEHLIKREVRDLIELAARHHITVVPEIDMPGHMGAALRRHPELQLKDPAGRANANNLDYTLAAARRFALELVDEYLDLFPGPYWHTGADEYLMTAPPVATPVDYAMYPQLAAYARARHGAQATAKDGILDFINRIGRLARERGKRLRVWNDGLNGASVVRLDRDVDVEWWTDLDGPSPSALLAAGHRIVNMGYYPTYYINGFPGGFVPGWPKAMPVPPKATARDEYEAWHVHEFSGPLFYDGSVKRPPQTVSPTEPAHLGAKQCIWNDDPAAATSNDTAHGVAPHLRVMAQKTWGTPVLTESFAEFSRIARRVGSPGAPRP